MELCGEWMPRKKAYCARQAGHGFYHRTRESMDKRNESMRHRVASDPIFAANKRQWNSEYSKRRWRTDPEYRERSNLEARQAHRLSRMRSDRQLITELEATLNGSQV